MKKKHLNSYLATKKPLLSIKDRLKRRKWYKERAAWTVEQWRKVILLAHLYTDRLNQHRYREILEDYLKPSMDVFKANSTWQFQQNNAPCHTARSIKQCIEEKRLNRMSCPARSPDLNPIENLWSWMDCKLQKSKPTNLVQLKTQMP